ncbi:MAG: outer membrane protein assembly factor BamD [Bdellovibrionota bacterium]
MRNGTVYGKVLPWLYLLAVYAMVSGCSSATLDNDSPPETQYAEGERLLGKDRYLEAVERFRILKSRYPYSKYAALATLKIGDTHFKDEAFLEAAAAYKIFRDLYPKHELASYALFRIGESFYNQMPSTTDRDLDPAQSAIDAYSHLISEYPAAPQRAEAEKRIVELRGKLAEKEVYVGDFYFKRELYEAAAGRYRYLLDQFPDSGNNEKSLYRLAFSYERMGEYAKADQAMSRLEKEFPKDEGVRKTLRKKIVAGLNTQEEAK